MKEQSIYKYCWFGTCIRFIQDAQAGWPIRGEEWFILENLGRFFEYLDELGLKVTHRAASELYTLKVELEQQKEKGATLSEEHASRLRELMTQVRKTLEAELQGYKAFVVTPKVLDTNKLLYSVDSLLAPGIFSTLPEIAKNDLLEAGKCIAFERPTAAAFHILRGTESVLRFFYTELISRKRVSPQLWFDIVADLRKRKTTKKYETLYNNLDNIRVSFRNPTQHPEKVYDIYEVQDLWSLCIEAINRMMKILSQKFDKERATSAN